MRWLAWGLGLCRSPGVLHALIGSFAASEIMGVLNFLPLQTNESSGTVWITRSHRFDENVLPDFINSYRAGEKALHSSASYFFF